MTGRYLIVGASRGIGAAAAAHLAARADRLFTASRSAGRVGTWIETDVSSDRGIAAIADAIGDAPLDGLLFLGGVWEEGAFTDAYDFAASPPVETRRVIDVNLVAPILIAQSLAPNLARGRNPRILLMGSTAGLSQSPPREVATAASKFGLRGAAQALAAALGPEGVAVTLINPDTVGTPEAEAEADIAAGRMAPQRPIPIADILATIDYVLGCAPATVPSEINLFTRAPLTPRSPPR